MKTHHLLNLSRAGLFGALVLTLAAGCRREPNPQVADMPAATSSPRDTEAASAMATLEPTQGNQVRGTVRFTSEGGGVRVVANLTGLTPGDHGFHVHENGDCSAPDASSAGGHFNPTNQPHAGRDAEERHIGDLGNLVADADGRAQLDYVDRKLTLTGANSIVGKAVIVHAGRDDLKSQPSGDAGGRVACGKIELSRRDP